MIETYNALLQDVLNFTLLSAMNAARALGFAFVFPVFSWMRLQGMIRIIFAASMGMPLTAAYNFALPIDLPTYQIVGLTIKEVLVGVVLAFAMGLPFWSVQAAGDIIDLQRGGSAANITNPLGASEASVTGTLMLIMSLVLFMSSGGMRVLMQTIYASYAVLPFHEYYPRVDFSVLAQLKPLFMRFLDLALLVAAPGVLCMLISDISVLFGTRSMRNGNLMDLTSTFKGLVVACLLTVYPVYLMEHLKADFTRLSGLAEIFLRYGGDR